MTDPWATPDLSYGKGPPVRPPLRYVLVGLIGMLLVLSFTFDAVRTVARRVTARQHDPYRVLPVPRPAGWIEVRGRVVHDNGAPLHGAHVIVTPHEGEFDLFPEGGVSRRRHEPASGTTTDRYGRYTIYVPPGGGRYDLTAELFDSPSATVFVVERADVRLPDIAMFPGGGTTRGGGTGPRTTLRVYSGPLRPQLGTFLDADVRVFAKTADGTQIALSERVANDAIDIDMRLLTSGTWTVATTLRMRTVGFDEVRYGWQGEIDDLAGWLPPALSKGRPCIAYGTRVVTVPTCALTDGDPLGRWRPTTIEVSCAASPCERPVGVDLGRLRDVGFVVAHGCAPSTDRIEWSADGRRWTAFATEGSTDVDVCAADVDVDARYVRVVGPASTYARRAEITVYETEPSQ